MNNYSAIAIELRQYMKGATEDPMPRVTAPKPITTPEVLLSARNPTPARRMSTISSSVSPFASFAHREAGCTNDEVETSSADDIDVGPMRTSECSLRRPRCKRPLEGGSHLATPKRQFLLQKLISSPNNMQKGTNLGTPLGEASSSPFHRHLSHGQKSPFERVPPRFKQNERVRSSPYHHQGSQVPNHSHCSPSHRQVAVTVLSNNGSSILPSTSKRPLHPSSTLDGESTSSSLMRSLGHEDKELLWLSPCSQRMQNSFKAGSVALPDINLTLRSERNGITTRNVQSNALPDPQADRHNGNDTDFDRLVDTHPSPSLFVNSSSSARSLRREFEVATARIQILKQSNDPPDLAPRIQGVDCTQLGLPQENRLVSFDGQDVKKPKASTLPLPPLQRRSTCSLVGLDIVDSRLTKNHSDISLNSLGMSVDSATSCRDFATPTTFNPPANLNLTVPPPPLIHQKESYIEMEPEKKWSPFLMMG